MDSQVVVQTADDVTPLALIFLPTKLITEVFKLLTWKDILHLHATCKSLSEAMQMRAIWAHLVKEHISRAPQLPLLECPLSMLTSSKLERLLLQWKSAEIGWEANDSYATSNTHTLTLYFLDSGSYSKGFLNWFGFFNPTEYNYICTSQIDWFLQESASIQQIECPFHPDDAKDLGHSWARQEQITPVTHKLAKPNALMFFHMPLPKSYAKADMNLLDVGLSGLEMPGNAKNSDGFFEKGVLKASESVHVSNGNVHEVKVIGNGHCHVTENCRWVQGVWLCFGGGELYSGYGKIGPDCRFRVYDISEYGEIIKMYKWTEKDEIVDEMILSGTGAALLS